MKTLEPVGDFQPYLDAVVKSGERTRSIIYVTLLVTFFVACGLRNFDFPDWDELRLNNMEQNYHCILTANPTDKDCAKLFADFSHQGLDFVLPGAPNTTPTQAPGAPNDFARRLYEDRISELMKSDVHANALQIPLFGVAIDGNDLWLVSGILMSILLLILSAHMQRELANFRQARAVCPNNTCRDLLTMAQIFALPSDDQGHSARYIRHAIFFVLYWLPAILNCLVVAFDLTNPESNAKLIGSTWNGAEDVVRVLSVISVGCLSFHCQRIGGKLHEFVVALKTELFLGAAPGETT